jgi:hypothetical protein
VIRVQQRPPDPEPLANHAYVAASRAPESAPPPVAPPPAPDPEPVLDLDDIDTPAYLRQGTLLN